MQPAPRAVVSGMGVICAAGVGCSALSQSMLAGSSAVRPWLSPSPVPLGLAPGGARHLETRANARDDQARCIELATRAAREAVEQAGLLDEASRADVAVVLGTNLVDRPAPLHELATSVADALGLGGPRLVVMLACASSIAALGVAHRLLADGDVHSVVAGGSDLTTPLVLAGFRTLGLLAPSTCVPFGPIVGTSLGEGAGFVVLELDAHARGRGVRPRFAVRGHGLAADAHHPTQPHPGGLGTARCISSALHHAGVDRSEVHHVGVHGTGTQANDLAEWRGLQRAFGEHARALWVSGSKGMLGHAQGAAGILELLTTLLAWERGMIPVTHASPGVRPGCEGMRLAVGSPQPGHGRVAAITSSGFGGLNVATVLERLSDDSTPPAPTTHGTRSRSHVALHGHATLAPPPAGVAVGVDLRKLLRGVELDLMDPTTRQLCLVTRLALLDADIELDRRARERTGLFAAIHGTSPQRVRELEASIDRHGPEGMSASRFVRALVTTPLGASVEALGLQGPVSLLSAGRAGGLLAVAMAAGWLCEHDDVDRLVAGAADEAQEPGAWEGGASVVLGRPTLGGILLASRGIAGPGCPEAAVGRALARAGLRLDDLDAVWGDPILGCARPQHLVDLGHAASTGTVALALAAGALERREASRVLVYVAQRGCIGVAVVLTQESIHGH